MNIIKCYLPFIDVKSTAIEVSMEQHSGIFRELCTWCLVLQDCMTKILY